MYTIIDQEQWPRREIFDFFATSKCPHYMVAGYIDVSRLLRFKREHHLSFYLSLVYLTTQTVNAIDNFRMRIVEGKPVIYDKIHANFTHKRSDEELYHIYTALFEGTLTEWVTRTSESIAQQHQLFAGEPYMPNLVYCSCNPTVDATAMSNPNMADPDDAIPRINWGKYVQRDGKWMVNVSVTPNHRFVDGYHVGLFFTHLQRLIDNLA